MSDLKKEGEKDTLKNMDFWDRSKYIQELHYFGINLDQIERNFEVKYLKPHFRAHTLVKACNQHIIIAYENNFNA